MTGRASNAGGQPGNLLPHAAYAGEAIDEALIGVLSGNPISPGLDRQDKREVVMAARLLGMSVAKESQRMPDYSYLARALRERGSLADLQTAAALLAGEDIPSERSLQRLSRPAGALATSQALSTPVLLPVLTKLPHPTHSRALWPVRQAARHAVMYGFGVEYNGFDPMPLIPFLYASLLVGLAKKRGAPDIALINAANRCRAYSGFPRLRLLTDSLKSEVPESVAKYAHLYSAEDDLEPLIRDEAALVRIIGRNFGRQTHPTRDEFTAIRAQAIQAESRNLNYKDAYRETPIATPDAPSATRLPYGAVVAEWNRRVDAFARSQSPQVLEGVVSMLSVFLDRAIADDTDGERFKSLFTLGVRDHGREIAQHVLSRAEHIAQGTAPAAIIRVAAHMAHARDVWRGFLSEQNMRTLHSALTEARK